MRYQKPVIGSSVDSTVHFQTTGKTFVAEPKHLTNDQLGRIRQLFQLADFQLVFTAPAGAVREQFRAIVKQAEPNIRSIGHEGGERYETVKSDLEYCNVLNEDDRPNKCPPANLVQAVDSILHG